MNGSPQSYRATMDWLNSRQQLGIEPGLDRIAALLEQLGNPQESFGSVHVAGTNGKGSVATLLSEVLRRSSHRVGLYTSPHLVEFGERIRVNGDQITREEIVGVLAKMRPAIDALDQTGSPPTFFEICTAAAFYHFRDREVSWAVVEAGMGGRSDATNVVHAGLSIITNVTMDHMAFLGDDIAAIALEKAGILEPGVPAVTGATGVALEVIEKEAGRIGASLVNTGNHIVDVADGRLVVSTPDAKTQTFQVRASGAHQARNAALAVSACHLLESDGVSLRPGALSGALAETPLPGRLEQFDRDGMEVIVDSAHNVAGAMAIAAELTGHTGALDLVIGFNEDKDWRTMLRHLEPMAREVFAVPVRSPRTLDPKEIEEAITGNVKFSTAGDVKEALRCALDRGADTVLVTGSIFLAGEARARLMGRDLAEVGGRQ